MLFIPDAHTVVSVEVRGSTEEEKEKAWDEGVVGWLSMAVVGVRWAQIMDGYS